MRGARSVAGTAGYYPPRPGASAARCTRAVRSGDPQHRASRYSSGGARGTCEPPARMRPMIYSVEQRRQIAEQAAGKVVGSLEYEESDGGYWVMTFTDDSEISFRFMAELVR